MQVAQFSAEMERYQPAIQIYEDIAQTSMDNNLLKYSAKGYLLNAGICPPLWCVACACVKGSDNSALQHTCHTLFLMMCLFSCVCSGRWRGSAECA